MTDYALVASLDQHVARGTYVKIQAESSKHKGLYGWTGATWLHGERWFVEVYARCDLTGYFQWFLLDDLWLASIADILSDDEKAARRRQTDKARRTYRRTRGQAKERARDTVTHAHG